MKRKSITDFRLRVRAFLSLSLSARLFALFTSPSRHHWPSAVDDDLNLGLQSGLGCDSI